jgi:hypothetical protein
MSFLSTKSPISRNLILKKKLLHSTKGVVTMISRQSENGMEEHIIQ